MFNFIRNLFKKELEKAEIAVEEAPSWFEEKTKDKFANLNSSLKENINGLNDILKDLKQNISLLEEAEVSDEYKVQHKVKNVVLAHRKNYSRILKSLADSVEIPEEINYKDILKIIQDLEKRLDELGKSTIKSYYAVQHLFHKELEAVANNLKELSKLSKDITEKITQSKVEIIDKSKEDINHLLESIHLKEDLKNEISEKKSILINLEKEKTEFENSLTQTKQGNEYLELKRLKQDLVDIEELIKKKEHAVIELFSPLEFGLRKFKRITLQHEDLVESYADSAMTALSEDKEFKIIQLLSNMKQSIESGSLDIKEQKKKKTLETIDLISKDSLNRMIQEYSFSLDRRKNVEDNLRLNSIGSKIKEIQYKQEHNIFKIDKIIKELDSIIKRDNEINLEDQKSKLEEKLREILNLDVTISF